MTDPATGRPVLLKRLPYPPGWPPRATADADQRDARARAAAGALADTAARTVLADGYDPEDPGVLIRLGSDHSVDAAASVYAGCQCTRHLAHGAVFVAAALALRVAQLEAELAETRGSTR